MGCKWCAGLLSPCGLGLGGGRVAALPLGRASLRPGAPGARQGGHARGRLGSTLGICGWHPCPGSRVPTRCLGPWLFQGKSRLAPSGGAPFSRSRSSPVPRVAARQGPAQCPHPAGGGTAAGTGAEPILNPSPRGRALLPRGWRPPHPARTPAQLSPTLMI